MKKRLSLQEKAEIAMKEAVQEVIERHIQTGRPLAIWRKGKIVRVSASGLSRINGK